MIIIRQSTIGIRHQIFKYNVQVSYHIGAIFLEKCMGNAILAREKNHSNSRLSR